MNEDFKSEEILPRSIVGNVHTDDFFEKNPEFLLLDFCIIQIDMKGREEASKMMWTLFLIYDPRTWNYERKTQAERIKIVTANYNPDFKLEDAEIYKEFYRDYVLVDDDVKLYSILYEEFYNNVAVRGKNGNLDIKNKAADKKALDELKNIVTHKFNKTRRVATQGVKQRGGAKSLRSKI